MTHDHPPPLSHQQQSLREEDYYYNTALPKQGLTAYVARALAAHFKKQLRTRESIREDFHIVLCGA